MFNGDYERYADDLFRHTHLRSYRRVAALLRNPFRHSTLRNDPAFRLQLSTHIALFDLEEQMSQGADLITQGQRRYLSALQEAYPEKTFYPEANFTMRLSYGNVSGYQPNDATWYNYYTTHRGIFEKENPADDEFGVHPDIRTLLGSNDFGAYANAQGELPLCFLTTNDITGGNSGSPVFNADGSLLGLAFDGNWEAMSGDIIFEPALQRCIAVDIRYILFLIDKWGQCPHLINELHIN
jgi:hypothetical protein